VNYVTLVFIVESGNCARVVIQLDCKFTQIDFLNRLSFKFLSQFLPLLLSAAMDATPPPANPPPATPPQIALCPPPRTSNDLRMLFSEAEQDIITKKGNSQLVKSWMYFYRLCLKDPLSFALVK
jgi:hypothetical protein